MRKLRSYALMLLAAVVLAATGCQRRPMEADYVPTVRVIVKCDWQYFCEEPTGMTMYFFRDGEDTPRVISTSQVNDVAVNLPAGHWRMFLINQSVYEFSSYEFFSMNKYAQAFVRLAEIKSKWYVPSKTKSISKETFIGHDPEHLAVALASEFDITHEMVDHYQSAYYEYRTRLKSKAPDSELDYYLSAMDEYTYVIPVTARDIISTVRARIYINNIRSLRSVRAALTGMAQNFMLTKDRTDEGNVDQLLELWVVEFDEEVPTRGYIESQVTTLGLPNGVTTVEGRAPELNSLGLNILMKDGKTLLKYDFLVGHKFQITKDESGLGLRLNLYLQEGYDKDPVITLPDVVVEEGGGGFKADVVDWEDEINVGIPI